MGNYFLLKDVKAITVRLMLQDIKCISESFLLYITAIFKYKYLHTTSGSKIISRFCINNTTLCMT